MVKYSIYTEAKLSRYNREKRGQVNDKTNTYRMV